MIEILLTQGQSAVIDNEDVDLNNLKWYASYTKYYQGLGAFVAVRHRSRTTGKPSVLPMHRVIMERILGRPLLSKEHVDHIDRNSLNNCRSNLRIANASQNASNRLKQANNTSGFKGVGWHKQRGKWDAAIRVNGKRIHLGLFDTPHAAYAAYCEAAIQYHGRFARV